MLQRTPNGTEKDKAAGGARNQESSGSHIQHWRRVAIAGPWYFSVASREVHRRERRSNAGGCGRRFPADPHTRTHTTQRYKPLAAFHRDKSEFVGTLMHRRKRHDHTNSNRKKMKTEGNNEKYE